MANTKSPTAKARKSPAAGKAAGPEASATGKPEGLARSAVKPTGKTPSNLPLRKGESSPSSELTATALARGDLVHLPPASLKVDPDQPRQQFDTPAWAGFVDEVRQFGILQPLLVARVKGTEFYELIAGERRQRASIEVGLPTVPCYCRELTEEQIGAARLIENDQREELNAIDRARAYQRHLEKFELSQEKLAAQLGISQGEVSHTIRLLRLPKDWQQQIMSRDMTQTQARSLVPWADLPDVLKAIREGLPKKKKFSDLTTLEWGELLSETLDDCCEPVSGNRYESGLPNGVRYDFSKLTAERREALQIRTYESQYCGKTEGCFNKALWKTLVDELISAERKKAGKKLERDVDGPKSSSKNGPAIKPKPTAAELKEKAEQHAKRIYAYRLRWLQGRIAAKVDQLPGEEAVALLVGMALIDGRQRRDLFDIACEESGQPKCKRDIHSDSKRWAWVMSLDRVKMKRTLQVYIREWTKLEARSWSCDANPAIIEHFATVLQIDLAPWQPDEDFLKLHTIDQLLDLMHEWRLPLAAGGKADLIRHIMANSGKCTAPKELREVKAVELR